MNQPQPSADSGVTRTGPKGLGDLLCAGWEPFSVSQIFSDNLSGADVRTTYWLRRPVPIDGGEHGR